MRQLGKASKTMAELENGDFLYYIDPKKPTEINQLTIKAVHQMEVKKGWVKVEYFQSQQALDLGAFIDTVPTRLLLVEGKAISCMSMSMPPTVYFSNKQALKKFMGTEYHGK